MSETNPIVDEASLETPTQPYAWFRPWDPRAMTVETSEEQARVLGALRYASPQGVNAIVARLTRAGVTMTPEAVEAALEVLYAREWVDWGKGGWVKV